MSSKQQYKDFAKRLNSTVKELRSANEDLISELKAANLKIRLFREAANNINPKNNLWKYIWVFNFGFAIGLLLMYFFK